MAFPLPNEYNEAIQNLRSTMSDDEIRQGEAAVNALGLPMPSSGNFADVYKVHCPATGNTWAVKCFTREVPGLKDRYRGISEHLEKVPFSFMVEFHYIEPGVRIGKQWYPFLKMRWVEGLRLNQFVADYLDKPKTLKLLLPLWVKLSAKLREAKIAHGDLQHGNVLLVPVPETGQLSLKLIDYDGMYVPALAKTKSGEVGHPSFQHPQRIKEAIYNADVDRFSHLAIYTAIQAVVAGKRELWDRFDNGDNVLFREADFQRPEASELFQQLWRLPQPELHSLVGRLILACKRPLNQCPHLDELVFNGVVLPLSPELEQQVSGIVGPGGVAVQTAPQFQQPIGGAFPSPQFQPPLDGLLPAAQFPQPVGGTVPAPLPVDLGYPLAAWPNAPAAASVGSQPTAAPVAVSPLMTRRKRFRLKQLGPLPWVAGGVLAFGVVAVVAALFLGGSSRGKVASTGASSDPSYPPGMAQGTPDERFFVGEWEVVVHSSAAATYIFTLADNHNATRSAPSGVGPFSPPAQGTWKLVEGRAEIQWSDGWKDVLRHTEKGVEKLAFFGNIPQPVDTSPARKMTAGAAKAMIAGSMPPGTMTQGTASPNATMPGAASPLAAQGTAGAVNLLAMTDIHRGGAKLQGDAMHGHGSMTFPMSLAVTNDPRYFQFPYSLPEEYTLAMDVERVGGKDGLSIGLLVGGSQVLVTLEGFGIQANALDMVDGKSGDKNPTTRIAPVFAPGRRTTIVCDVKSSSVTVTRDGQPLIQWSGNPEQLSLDGRYRRGIAPDKPFLAVWNASFRFSRLEIIPHSPAAVARSAPEPAPGDSTGPAAPSPANVGSTSPRFPSEDMETPSKPPSSGAQRRRRMNADDDAAQGWPTKLVGNVGGARFRDVGDGSPVLGFVGTMGEWMRKPAFKTLATLYTRDKPSFGRYLMAKEGYAVGALDIKSNPYVAAIRVVFMRLGDDGKLDKEDTYKSEWFGARNVGGTPETVGGDGRKVIGIHGCRILILDALGLVME